MNHVRDKVVLITGASSGIGEATARLLAASGARVVLGARRVEKLEALAGEIRSAGGQAAYQALDVSDRQAVADFAAFAMKQFGRIDVLVNNAGVMPVSLLSELRVDDWDWMIDVNIRGVLHGIAATLPIMEAQGQGQIINVASVAGLRASPTAAVYCATKFAVRAISDGLRQETDKVRVTIINPGYTVTDLVDTIPDPNARVLTRQMTGIQPDAIARAILYAVDQPSDTDVSEVTVRHVTSPI